MVAKSLFHRQVMLRHLTCFLEWAPRTQTPHKAREDLVILATNPSANRAERERSLVDSRSLYKRGWKQLQVFTKEWEDGSMKDKMLLFTLYKNVISTQKYSCHYRGTSCPPQPVLIWQYWFSYVTKMLHDIRGLGESFLIATWTRAPGFIYRLSNCMHK